MNKQELRRIEFSRELIRRACDGCCGIPAQVNGSTCLVMYPEHYQEWCVFCLMAGAAEYVREPAASVQSPVLQIPDSDFRAVYGHRCEQPNCPACKSRGLS
jgi:hypothetical protein